jgi:Fe2+ transport system protein FeoA
MNLTLQGAGSAARVASQIGGAAGSLLGGLSPDPDTLNELAGKARELSDSWLTDANGSLSGMTTISANGAARKPNTDDAYSNNKKWLRVETTAASSPGNGLNLKNLRFASGVVEYSITSQKSGIVNGLIGNINLAGVDASLGNITGSAFTDLSVTVKGSYDTDYLAGGGIIGIRSTGETSSQKDASASAKIGTISGNLFKGVRVTTTGSVLTDWSTNPATTTSAYIEGGGLIGVDAVSSPADKTGIAEIEELSNNIFSDVQIRTDDILIGGGLVGVNNNSKHELKTDAVPETDLGYAAYKKDVESTYSVLGAARGNVFKDVSVDVGYSLRGGGVIGLNGLSTAGARLTDLSGNIFSGIDVTSRLSYIKGGGIVGLQSNYTDSYDQGKFIVGDDIVDFDDVDFGLLGGRPVLLTSAAGNLFLDLNVKSATYLYGGGIIGLYSSKSLASLGELKRNLFKGLTVKTYGKKDADDEYGLKGGGIVGISTGQSGMLGEIRDNYFDDIEVDIAEKLAGGGVLGIQSDLDGELAFGSDIVDNSFTNIGIEAKAIEGGGIVGARGLSDAVGFGGTKDKLGYEDGLSGNRLSGITIAAEDYISGGGVFGVYADQGSATLYDVNNNVLDNITVTAGKYNGAGEIVNGYIEGGGLVGIRSNFVGLLQNLENNYFYDSKVTAGTYIDGGGIVGLTTGNPEWKQGDDSLMLGISNIEDNLFAGNEITANNGTISGGLIYSYGTPPGDAGAPNSMTIKNSYFYNNTFTSKITDSAMYADDTISPKVYGTVTVDTGSESLSGSPFTVTLDARPEAPGEDGERVIAFNNNKIVEIAEDGTRSERTNSLYFGTVDGIKNNEGKIEVVHDEADADAKLVVQTEKGGTVFLYDPIEVNQDNGKTFEMVVTSPDVGNNKETGYFAWGGKNVFTVAPDKNGEFSNDKNNKITLETGSYTQLMRGMTLYAPHHSFILEGPSASGGLGAQLNVMGGNELTLRDASLNGSILFDLNGTTLNDASTALLKIHGTEVDIDGSTIYLAPFKLENNKVLREGDRFYLIATDNEGDITGKQTNKYASAAYGRNGYTMGYNFIIDTFVPKGLNLNPKATAMAWYDEEETHQYLVARLPFHRDSEVDPNPPYVQVHSEVDGDPPHVEIGSAVGEPLHVEVKSAVGDPLHVEIGSAKGEPLVVEVKSAAGEPLHVEVKSAKGEPLAYSSAVGEPLHVETKSAKGDPLYVEIKSAVDEPLHVEVKSAVGEPPHVEVKSAVDTPLHVEVKSAVGDPLHVEVKSEVGKPPVIRLPETGNPLYVIQYADVDGNPPVVYVGEKVTDNPPYVVITDSDDPQPVVPVPVKTDVDEPLVVYVQSEVDGDPPYVILVPTPTPDEGENTPTAPQPPVTSSDIQEPDEPSKDTGETPDPKTPKTDGPDPDPDPGPDEPPVAYETTAITNGRLAGLAFAGARGTWLSDHSYESANIILSKDLREADWQRVSAPFAGIDGAWLRTENDHSHIKIDSMNVIAGYAVKTRHEGHDGNPDSSSLLGAFLDIGHGSYTTYDHFDHVLDGAIPDIHGNGTLRAYGLGVMARKEWANGFRLEGSLRAGKLENEFSAGDYVDANGVPMSYETDTPYYGAHVGIGRTFRLADPANEVDILLRYYWDRQGGETVTLPNGEIVDFSNDDSHRLRFGARYTHEDDKLRRWYIGAAVEHEYAGDVHARSGNFDLQGYRLVDLRSESLGGTTGIAELGVDIRPYKNRDFSIATGIQGYFGKYRGLSAGIRFEWEF